ncbi:MAG: enoyl-CoA hydratase [Thermodesulfobacteriota bacterium]
MIYRQIKIEMEGHLAHLILNRPDKYNALSRETVQEMITALKELAVRPEVRVVIIRAEGKHFCSGHDLSEMNGADTAAYREIFQNCVRMMTLLHEIPQPVIAQVHGVATAAGCQLVAACDLALAEEGASFATPGVRIGLFCATPMVPLCRAIGRKRAMEMLLTGRAVPAAEAVQWGLVNRVVPKAELADQVRQMALSIAEASRLTIEMGKQAFYDQIDQDEDVAYSIAQNVMTTSINTLDAQEGIKAFLQKRKPSWLGR